MRTITAKVCGDVWCNPDEFRQELENTCPDEPLFVDMRAEGPSLQALGILDTLIQHCCSQGKAHELVKIINAPNNQERTVFENTHTGISHFFCMALRYWTTPIPSLGQEHRFAMFVGRNTVARCAIMYDLYHDWVKPYFLFSTMQYRGKAIWDPYPGWRVIEDFQEWLESPQLELLKHWWSHHRPVSLDDANVRDQYDKDKNTNRSILLYYSSFNIELICESYTLGNSFFPTEKTVRPILATKPFLLYGPVGFLDKLRQLGFHTYHDIWDEDYDQYQGIQRWAKIKQVINGICALSPQQFQHMMQKASPIANYNRGVLADMIVNNRYHAMIEAGVI